MADAACMNLILPDLYLAGLRLHGVAQNVEGLTLPAVRLLFEGEEGVLEYKTPAGE